MGGHVLIVDMDPGRRAALLAGLALPEGEVIESDTPEDLPVHVAQHRPDLLLLDLGEPAEPALEALRWIRRRPGGPLPAIALVPPERPDLRLSALHAGAEDATERDTSLRVLQARIRSLLRQRDSALDMAPREAPEAALPGLSEAPAAFTYALFAPGGPSPRSRVALLSTWRNGACPPPEVVARLLGAEVTRLDSAAGAASAEGDGFDLVMIDGAGTRGDLAQRGQVLAQIAELQGRLRARNTAILVLLPASAVETAALALDLGASDVVAGAVSPREIVLRARALIARNRLREALRDQVRRGLRAAMTDPLTGLHNRRYAEACLRRLAEEARESRRGLALVMIDIDHFKSINDTHGHAAGDRVLVEAALRLRAVLRPTDLLARVGGEEFLVALPDAGPEEAGLIAERLRRAIGRQPFALDDPAPSSQNPEREPLSALLPRLRPASIPPEREGEGAVRVTVSIGVAAASAERLGAGLELAELLRRADQALYEAKSGGRDAVATAPVAA